MDCRRAQDALASLRDGCEADAETSAAFEHAVSCPECASFSSALGALAAIPPPTAPRDLADRISHAVSVAAEADLVDENAASALAAALTPPPGPSAPVLKTDITGESILTAQVSGLPPWLTRTRLWATTGAITLAAAGIVVAVIVSGQTADQTELSVIAQEGLRAGIGAADQSGAPAVAAPGVVAPVTPAKTPDYVAYKTFAYAAGAAVDVVPSQATTVATIQTALRGGTVRTVSVLQAPGSVRDIILALPDGGYQTFTVVTRSLGNRTFQLHSGPVLDRFGTWPTLPQGYTQPPDADGSPYYRAAGTDSLGVPVYVRIGQTPDLGFGIAPGTPATDPAAGNPNWTWWSPDQ